ncbi:hypothetical protein BSL78_23326 [Apostichopus japonicus]|uniref:Uncharacterized protein n=1 Tax=Stichopus japonicus TaxID=307972 RepID=A0A2G8JVX6_STIJA|nr:hypothetical protein BSL78_23326 [Apostichopus japonicus]
MVESPEEKVPRHRVPLGNQWERLSEAKRNLHLKSDSEVARLLLDRFTRNFSKSAGRWTCVPVMEKNSYKYIPQLMKDIFRRRLDDDNSQLGVLFLPRMTQGTSLVQFARANLHQFYSFLQAIIAGWDQVYCCNESNLLVFLASASDIIFWGGGVDGVVAQLVASHQSRWGLVLLCNKSNL